MQLSTMQDFPLTITTILRHGRTVHGESESVTWMGDHTRRETFAEIGRRRRPPCGPRCAVSVWARASGSARSVEHRRSTWRRTSRSRAIGAVLHTLNIRLFPEQLAYVAITPRTR